MGEYLNVGLQVFEDKNVIILYQTVNLFEETFD